MFFLALQDHEVDPAHQDRLEDPAPPALPAPRARLDPAVVPDLLDPRDCPDLTEAPAPEAHPDPVDPEDPRVYLD